MIVYHSLYQRYPACVSIIPCVYFLSNSAIFCYSCVHCPFHWIRSWVTLTKILRNQHLRFDFLLSNFYHFLSKCCGIVVILFGCSQLVQVLMYLSDTASYFVLPFRSFHYLLKHYMKCFSIKWVVVF